MKANKRKNTKPEIAIRSLLHRRGLRFKKDVFIKINDKNCRPDIVFKKAKLVVFIDGCFWHLCPQHGHIPKNNVQYWEEKLNRNRDKDNADTKLLTENGWHVLRIWEHVPIEEAVDIIARNLKYLAESNNVPKIISQNI
jgi:DNA mismatch endonuclease (patch repair protein)